MTLGALLHRYLANASSFAFVPARDHWLPWALAGPFMGNCPRAPAPSQRVKVSNYRMGRYHRLRRATFGRPKHRFRKRSGSKTKLALLELIHGNARSLDKRSNLFRLSALKIGRAS